MTDLKGFFNPKSVAVIGASQKPDKIGNALLRNIIKSGYRGIIYPINPNEQEVEKLPSYPNVSKLPGPVDLAVIAVPAARVPGVAEECGTARIKFLVVISAGFKEVGSTGLALQKELVRICQKYSIRMLGPNCLGMLDTHLPINATFGAIPPLKGEIAFISQSGAMLLAMIDWSNTTGLGFSKIVSLGNKADLAEADFIAEAAADPNTKAILCYLEDVANGNYFLEVASQASHKKPLIIFKSGTSQAGARAASSHTGALAGSDLAYETAFRQYGVIRARSMTELFDLALTFSSQPIPNGENVAVITNSGGPGIITTDSIELKNLKMARFSKETIKYLRENLPPEANIYNPVDVLGDAGPDRYRTALEKVLSDSQTHCVLVLVCPTAVADPLKVVRAIIEFNQNKSDKPLLAVLMGGESFIEGSKLLNKAGIPCFTFPEPAVTATSGLIKYAQVKKLPLEQKLPDFPDIDKARVAAILKEVKKDRRLVLLGSEALNVSNAYGIPVAPTILATTPEEAAKAADKTGYPVILKVASPKILHKTDIGGVKAGINSAEDASKGFLEIIENIQHHLPRASIYGIEVQKMMSKGIELIIGMTRDIQFGPLIAFGLGGIYVNLLKDVSFRLAQGLSLQEIKAMISETKAYTLLRGYRGEKPADLTAINEVIGRVARLVMDFPEISELDINPLFAYQKGTCAVDVKITIS